MKIGITGGIGSGKSTVSEYLTGRGHVVIDADKIAREITEPGSGTLLRLEEQFGHEIIMDDGNLDRKKLAAIVFEDSEKRKILDDITHGEIYDIILDRLKKNDQEKGIVFVDAALFFETGLDRAVDAVWVVKADMDQRLQRVEARDDTGREQVLARMKTQMSDAERCRLADEVLDNSGNLDELHAQIAKLLKKYGRE